MEQKLVTIKRYDTIIAGQAHIDKMILEDNYIDAVILGEDVGAVIPHICPVSIELQVTEHCTGKAKALLDQNAERAKALLDQYEEQE